MALKIVLDGGQYFQGLLTLTRGDDWCVTGSIVDRVANYVDSPVNITGWGLTGNFPGLTGTVSVVDAVCGRIQINAPASATPNATLEDSGVTLYVEAYTGTKQQTIQTWDAPLSVVDPGNNTNP